MKDLIIRFAGDEGGSTSIEYGLIASMIALVIITATRKVGTNLSAKFGAVANNLT